MGYRNYIGILRKDYFEEIRACKTQEELLQVYKKHKWRFEHDDDYIYTPVYGPKYKETFEFGKYTELGQDFDSRKHPIFPEGHPIASMYKENDFEFGGEDLLLAAIENYRLRIRDYFAWLLKVVPDDAYEQFLVKNLSEAEKKEKHYNRMISAIREKSCIWGENVETFGLSPFNLKKDNPKLVSSWLYEYEIFELISMYKRFDPEKYVVIYYGY